MHGKDIVANSKHKPQFCQEQCFSSSGLHCVLCKMTVDAPSKSHLGSSHLGSFCGILPKFVLYSKKNKMYLSFLVSEIASFIFTKGLFQVLNRDTLETKAFIWGPRNYKNASIGKVSIFNAHISHFANLNNKNLQEIIHMEWTVLSPADTILHTKIELFCTTCRTIELYVYKGFTSFGNLMQKYDCHSSSQTLGVKRHDTFLISHLVVVKSLILPDFIVARARIESLKISRLDNQSSHGVSILKKRIIDSQEFCLTLSNEHYTMHQLESDEFFSESGD